ncbi:dimethylaniline monooxygenase, partial [Mycobacterium kansasii]
MKSVHGSRVTFSDGHDGQFDALVFGTGYQLSLPLLDARTRALLNVGATHFDSDRHTFHPDLPGLAFVGLWDQSG